MSRRIGDVSRRRRFADPARLAYYANHRARRFARRFSGEALPPGTPNTASNSCAWSRRVSLKSSMPPCNEPLASRAPSSRSACDTGSVAQFKLVGGNGPANEGVPTAECLRGRVNEVRGYLRRKGFSDHAIEHATTVLYRVAMPYVNGTKICELRNRRAWAFKVAIRAAVRAATREVRFNTVEPAILEATVAKPEPNNSENEWDISDALKKLTKKQSDAVEACTLRGLSQRAAAKEMGIAVSTLCGHLSAAKERLKELLTPFLRPPRP